VYLVEASQGQAMVEALLPPNEGTWVIDLDGVVWLTEDPIPGTADAVTRLHHLGIRTLFATNNSALTKTRLLERLARCGVHVEQEDVVSSADAVATLIDPGSTAVLLADEGVAEALEARGVTVVPEGPADVVVVGLTESLTFDRLALATSAVMGGARLYASNDDATRPTPSGLLPGAGSILAAVVKATGETPVVAGKPRRPMADVIRQRADDVALVVGDRLNTDGEMARQLGVPFGLVYSGVTRPGDPLGSPAPDFVADRLQNLAEQLPD
jgi:glycerol-1-phosphatase